MADQEYIERLEHAIGHMHNCDSTYLETVQVHETLNGKTVWQGEVEVFAIIGHRRASKCYAWSTRDANGKERFTAVLGTSPVKTPADAVRVSIVAKTNEPSTG